MKILSCTLVLLVLLSGCILGTTDCKTDKGCLKAAFAKCERAHGIWEGRNGDIDVTITGNKDGRCGVAIQVLESGLNMSGKNMTCLLPMPGSTSILSIKTDCDGELETFFSE